MDVDNLLAELYVIMDDNDIVLDAEDQTVIIDIERRHKSRDGKSEDALNSYLMSIICPLCQHPKHVGRCMESAPNAQFTCACQGPKDGNL